MILNTLTLNLVLNSAAFMAGLSGARTAATSFATTMSTGVGLAAVGVSIGLIKATQAAIEWEDAMLGVQKTVELTNKTFEQEQEFFAALGQDLLDMSKRMPVAAIDLAHMAEAAGALGVAEDEIKDFVEAAATLSGLAEDVTPERAARAFGTIRTVMGLTTEEYMKMTSAVIQLGISGASTEGDILSMAERASGAFGAVGISVEDLMGWSAAMSNVREQSEAGGTTLQRMSLIIQRHVVTQSEGLNSVAKAAQMTTEEFSTLFRQDPSDAMQAWINGLADVDSEMRGVLLRAAGFGDIRLTRGLNKVINAVAVGLEGNLNDALEDSTRGFNDAELVAKMTEERWKGVAQQAAILGNIIHVMALDIGEALLPIVAMAVEHFKNLFTIIGDLIHSVPGLTNVITPLVAAIAGLTALRFGASMLGMFLPLRGVGRMISATIGKGNKGEGIVTPLLFGGMGKAINGVKKAAGGLFRGIGRAAGAAGRLGAGLFLGAWMAVFLIIKAELDALHDLQRDMQKNIATIDEANKTEDAWLATLPPINEVQKKIEQMRAENEKMWQGQFHGLKFITDAASQFGMRQGVALEDQIKQYEEYIKAVERGDMVTRSAMSRMGGYWRGVREHFKPSASGIEDMLTELGFDAAKMAEQISTAYEQILGNMGKDTAKKLAEMKRAVLEGFGNIKEALKKENLPMIISRGQRLENMEGRMQKVMRNLRNAVQKRDPLNESYWMAAAQKLRVRMEQMRANQGKNWKDVKDRVRITARDVQTTWSQAALRLVEKSEWATGRSKEEIRSMATLVTRMDLSMAGSNLMISLATGMQSAMPLVRETAMEAAAEIAKYFEPGGSPPVIGPLSHIDSDGTSLIKTFAGGIRAGGRFLRTASDEAARMFSPDPTMSVAAARGMVPGPRNVVNVTINGLYGGEAGLRRLNREIEQAVDFGLRERDRG